MEINPPKPTEHMRTDQFTTANIAQLADVPMDRVLYFLKTRPHIRPAGRVGIYRLFTKEQLDLMLPELQAMKRGRTAGTKMQDGKAIPPVAE